MAYHLAAFYSSLDAAGAFTPVVPIADPMLFVQGNAIRVPTDMPNLIWLAGGADATVSPQFRLTSPSLTTVGRPQIQPVNVTSAAAALPGSPFNIMWVNDNPIALAGDELLTCDLLNNPGAAQFQWAMIQFGDSTPTPKRSSLWISREHRTAINSSVGIMTCCSGGRRLRSKRPQCGG